MKTINTKRLLLRKFNPYDCYDMFEYLSDVDVQLPAGGVVHQTITHTRKLLEKLVTRDNIWAIELVDENKVIGAIGAYNLTQNDILERHIGFELNKKYWNKGYVTEAAQAMIKHLFEDLRMDRVVMSHYPFNEASERIAEKLGFVKEGYLRKEDRILTGKIVDRVIYSIIKEEYFK